MRGYLGLARAHVGGLKDGTEKAFGRDRISVDEVPVTVRYAAEILRPWLIQGHAEDHPTDLARAQLLWLRGECEKCIDLAFGEQLHGVALWRDDPVEILAGIEPDLCRNDRKEQVPAAAELIDAELLALQIADGSDGLVRNSPKHPECTPDSARIGSPASR